MSFQICQTLVLSLIGVTLSKPITQRASNEETISIGTGSLVVDDEETKTLLAWLNMINMESSGIQTTSDNARARAISAPPEEPYVEKDGFVVAKAPALAPSLLGKCKGFAYILVGPCE